MTTMGPARRLSNQQAACDIASAMSSFGELGKPVICSMNGSAHEESRLTYQLPASHSAAAANKRAVLPPSGFTPITPGTVNLRRSMIEDPLALSSTKMVFMG